MVKLTQRSCNLKVVGRARIWTSVWYQLLFSFYSLASNTQSQPTWLHCRCQSHVMGSLLCLSTLPWGRGHSWTCHRFSSVAQSCLTLWDPMDCSTPGLPVHHQLPELTQTHVHWVGDAIQSSHSLLSPSLPAFNFSQHQGLFKWVSSSHQVAKVLEIQLQHQAFQWTPRTDLL